MLLLHPAAELHLSFAAARATPSTGTPESLPRQEDEEGSEPPSTGLRFAGDQQQHEHGSAAAAQVRLLQNCLWVHDQSYENCLLVSSP